MQKVISKYHMAAWAVLAVIMCFLSVRPANATIFNFSGSCDNLFCPALGFGSDGSAVTGQLEILDSAVGPGLTFANTEVVSLTLIFELRNLDYTGPFFNSLMLSGPVGQINATGLAVEQINILDNLDQSFEANLATEGSFFFSAVDSGGLIAEGAPISFEIATTIPEPASMAMFLFSIGSMVFMARRRQRSPVTRMR